MAAVDALLARSYPKLLKVDCSPSILVAALPIISRLRPELLVCDTYYVAEEGASFWAQGDGQQTAKALASDISLMW